MKGRLIILPPSTVFLVLVLTKEVVKTETDLELPENFRGWPVNFGYLARGDYTADNVPDMAVKAIKNNDYDVYVSQKGEWSHVTFSIAGDVPLHGDYDGDGFYDFCVFRPSRLVFYHKSYMRQNDLYEFVYGKAGDIPMNGDYTGDGFADFVLWRPSNGTFYVTDSQTLNETTTRWGSEGYIPISGDYDFDGINDYVVWSPYDTKFYIKFAATGKTNSVKWGKEADIPIAGDFTFDGKADFAVYRPSQKRWHIKDGETSKETVVVQR